MARTTLLAALAVLGLSAPSSAQDPFPRSNNAGGDRAHVFAGHKLSGKAAAQQRLIEARAATAPRAFQEKISVAAPDTSAPELTNTGELRRAVFAGHDLSAAASDAPVRVLYAPSEDDDGHYRTAIALAIGSGARVDYFDARFATPDLATLLQYDAVYTWANFAYHDKVLFGDNLALYNDQGGTVVLGVFCTYTSGNSLAGAIMGPAYCPVVSPLGTNHFTSATYAGGGTSCIYNAVSTLTSGFRDVLVTQGTGVADGFYPDGEICHAYRPPVSGAAQGDVVYSNGCGASQLAGAAGEWMQAVGNACVCSLAGPKILYAPSEADDPAYRDAISAAAGGVPVEYFDAIFGTPTGATLAEFDCVHVWTNFAFADNVLYGDNLATYVDNGGDVVLGAFCTYTSGFFLSGKIMTPDYCPVVSPTGSNHFSLDTDQGPYFSCLTAGATALSATYRDVLAVQKGGVFDSVFDGDKEIATAFRRSPGGGAGDVIYANGSGGAPIGSPADGWPLIVANGWTCDVGSQGPAGSCAVRLGVLGTNPTDTACVDTPIVGEIWNVTVSLVPSVGTATTSTFVVFGFGGPTSGVPAFAYELLILPPYVETVALGAHAIPVPPVADFIGQPLTMQGARLEANPDAVVLTNAVDLVPGIN